MLVCVVTGAGGAKFMVGGSSVVVLVDTLFVLLFVRLCLLAAKPDGYCLDELFDVA